MELQARKVVEKKAMEKLQKQHQLRAEIMDGALVLLGKYYQRSTAAAYPRRPSLSLRLVETSEEQRLLSHTLNH